MVQTLFVWPETWLKTQLGIYVIVLKWLELKIVLICLKLRGKLEVFFFSIFSTFSNQVQKTWFVWQETWHTTIFGICFLLKWLESKTIVICLKLRAKLHFKGFLSVFGTFSHKVAQS